MTVVAGTRQHIDFDCRHCRAAQPKQGHGQYSVAHRLLQFSGKFSGKTPGRRISRVPESTGAQIAATLITMMALCTFNPARGLKQARHAPILRRNILIINIFLFSPLTQNEIAIALPSS
jgi:hypothetical protein